VIVKRIELRDFRGVSGHLTADFSDGQDDRAHSVILYGDNGSGKSSIVDALEFGLRGRLSRRGLHGVKRRREVRNLVSGRAPGVLLTMNDGALVHRGGGIRDSSVPDRGVEVVDGFGLCPIVIRRQDVEAFWTVPSNLRQEFFFDYLRDLSLALPGANDAKFEEVRKREALEELDHAREIFQNIVGEDIQLPETHEETSFFMNKVLMERFGDKVKGGKRQVEPSVYRSFRIYQGCLKKFETPSSVAVEQADTVFGEQNLRRVLQTISGRVSEDFAAVARKEWIAHVDLALDEGAGLDISLRLANGRTVDPVQILNEAALDLLALLILVEVHVECSLLGQKKLLVLDDVFQSVDSVHRVRSLEHVMRRLKGWQVIVSLHDRLWLELARAALQRNSRDAVRTITVRATPHGEPPELRVIGNGPLHDLKKLLSDHSSPELLAGGCGRALEQLCDRLSVNLATSVTRRRGDKYTLGDLWPGVHKALKGADIEGLADASAGVGAFLVLRNIAGAHYNSWAESLGEQEAADFAEAVIDLWNLVACATCGNMLSVFRPQEGSRSIIDFGCKCVQPDADIPVGAPLSR
jgi:hypothetical protein